MTRRIDVADADVTETAPYIDTVVEEARRRDFDVVLSTTDEGPSGIDRLAGRRVADAFVLMDVRAEDARLPTAAGLGVPVILLGRPSNRHGLDAVDFDARAAAELIVDDLVATGHRRIMLIGESPEVDADRLPFIQEFHDGARRRAEAAGLQFTLLPRRRAGWAGMEDLGDTLFANVDDRLGIIARTPRVTEWVVQLMRLSNLAPGRDVSLVSLCTDAYASSFDPPISNVSPQPRDMSRRAMTILFSRIDGDQKPDRLELVEPGPVTRRASTAVFR